MTSALSPVTYLTAHVWNSRRACQVNIFIAYQSYEQDGCTVYNLRKLEELEKQAA